MWEQAMSVSWQQVQAFANQFLPSFVFDPNERVFPVSVESWLEQCAASNWQSSTDPHAGTATVEAQTPISLVRLKPQSGCQGTAGAPIDPTQQLAFSTDPDVESFIDFAGWSSLPAGAGDLSEGNDGFILSYFAPYFSQILQLEGPAPAQGSDGAPQRPGTNGPMPANLTIYCEAEWAGDFTRLSIQNQLFDFAATPAGGPDPELDPFFVLTYYLFYPLTEPPPSTISQNVPSPFELKREGQWEAVSLYFPTPAAVNSAADLVLPDPATATPDFVVLSQGITRSSDGRSPQLSASYPAESGRWLTPSAGGGQQETQAFTAVSEVFPGQFFVTCGTHKNLFANEVPPEHVTTSIDPGWGVAGGVVGGAGSLISDEPIAIIFFILVGILLAIWNLDDTSTEVPDSSGDVANLNGPAAGTPPGSGAPPPPAPLGINLVIMSMLPNAGGGQPPAWWSYPGRWGVAVDTDSTTWDSGGRRIDFVGRSRAYWNTVALQAQNQSL
jgi:hypothetical protein